MRKAEVLKYNKEKTDIIYHVDTGCDKEVLAKRLLADEEVTNDSKEIMENIKHAIEDGYLYGEDFLRVTEKGWALHRNHIADDE